MARVTPSRDPDPIGLVSALRFRVNAVARPGAKQTTAADELGAYRPGLAGRLLRIVEQEHGFEVSPQPELVVAVAQSRLRKPGLRSL